MIHNFAALDDLPIASVQHGSDDQRIRLGQLWIAIDDSGHPEATFLEAAREALTPLNS